VVRKPGLKVYFVSGHLASMQVVPKTQSIKSSLLAKNDTGTLDCLR
jgi:hypothetical protein